jgi:hypothetical protein
VDAVSARGHGDVEAIVDDEQRRARSDDLTTALGETQADLRVLALAAQLHRSGARVARRAHGLQRLLGRLVGGGDHAVSW